MGGWVSGSAAYKCAEIHYPIPAAGQCGVERQSTSGRYDPVLCGSQAVQRLKGTEIHSHVRAVGQRGIEHQRFSGSFDPELRGPHAVQRMNALKYILHAVR